MNECLLYFYIIKQTKTKKMQDYINNIIKTGLANGLTIEQLMANPEAAAKAYLDSQLKAIDKASKQLSNEQ